MVLFNGGLLAVRGSLRFCTTLSDCKDKRISNKPFEQEPQIIRSPRIKLDHRQSKLVPLTACIGQNGIFGKILMKSMVCIRI